MSEERASPEVQEKPEEQPAAPETAQEPTPVEAAEPEAEPQPEATEPEPTPEEKPAEGEPEQAEKPEAEGEKKEEEGAGEEQPTEEAPAEAEKEEEPEEEPIVITPEGNPHWLSTEDVLAKGLPESEVENFKYFYFKHAHSIQAFYESVKDFAVQTEFITISKEEIEALTVEGDVSEEQQQVLNGLQERINAVIELYEDDGALVKINGKTAKDAILEKTEESFVETIRDAVINSLEIEKQSICAYSIWKDQEHQPGAFKRGINKIRASFRRSRTGSAGARPRKAKVEEEKKEDSAAPEESKPEGEEPKPAEEGAAPPTEGGEAEGEATAEVTVEVDMEQGEDKSEEAAAKEEEPKEEAKAEDEPKQEEAPAAEAPAEEEPKEEAKEEEPKQEEAPAEAPATEEEPKQEAADDAEKKEDGEIQAADKEEGGENDGEEVKSKPKSKSSTRKPKPAVEEHQHKAAKSEPLDNRVLRAFGRVMGARYQVKDGKAALEQLRGSVHIRNDLNKLKAFGGVEGVQVSLSVCRWLSFIPEQTGMMFRAFVYENELTALSQYNDNTYFPNVVHYKDTVIRPKVQQFFQDHVKEALKDLNNYVVDIFVAPEKIYVIRLNPFHTKVGACLFTWNEHARVLTKGPFEFHVVEAPKMAPEAYSSYQPCWQDMLNSVLSQRKTESRTTSSNRCVIL